ncbi:MAG: cyclic nucleotide-binding domain-containing protein [Actinomycetota bacterium]|nr:cyclic nucleotide-binding domain-containing protein [Actinomycetota bacterium]
MIEDLSELVGRHPLFAGLPADVSVLVAGCAHNAAFGPNELVLAEGGHAEEFYLLRRGRVTLEVHAPGRGPLAIDTLGPGSVLGLSWLFPPYRWSFDARSLEPVGAISVDATCLRDKAEADPAFGFALMKRLGAVLLERLEATRIRLLDVYGDARPT